MKMRNMRETAEALGYIQDQRLPPQMAVEAFEDRIQENREPQVVQPVIFEEGETSRDVTQILGNSYEEKTPFTGSFEALEDMDRIIENTSPKKKL